MRENYFIRRLLIHVAPLLIVRFGRGFRDVYRRLFDDVILPAKRLSDVGVEERDEGEGSERLRYKYVCYFPVFGKIFTEIVRCDVFRTPTNEHFARDLLWGTLEQ